MRKVLISEKVLISGWRISHIRYSLYRIDSSIKIRLFVYNFQKNFSDLKNVSCIA